MNIRLVTLCLLGVVSGAGLDLLADQSVANGRKVYVLPIRDEFNTQMVYLVRRGVKAPAGVRQNGRSYRFGSAPIEMASKTNAESRRLHHVIEVR